MLGGQLPAIGFGDQTAFRDADQRVMRFVIVFVCKERFVGRDQRQTFRIGEIEQRALAASFLRHAVTLQFDIETVAEQRGELVAARGGKIVLSGGEREIEHAMRPAGERDQTLRFAFEPIEFQMRLLVRRRFEECARIEAHQAAIAGLLCRQQNHARHFTNMRRIARIALLISKIDGKTTTNDGLDAGTRHFFGKFQSTEHIIGVSERERRLTIRFRELGKARNR